MRELSGTTFDKKYVIRNSSARVMLRRPCVIWWDNFNRMYRRALRTGDTKALSICNWTAQGLMQDETVDSQVNVLRWRFGEVVTAMPNKPLGYKQLVVTALNDAVGPTNRRNGDIPDWVSGAVCLQIPITRVPLKPLVGAVINGEVVDVPDKGLKTFVPIGIKDVNIGKNTDLAKLLREFMQQQTYPYSTKPTDEELVTCRYTWLNVDVGNFSRMYKVFIFQIHLSTRLILKKIVERHVCADVLRRAECGPMSSTIHQLESWILAHMETHGWQDLVPLR